MIEIRSFDGTAEELQRFVTGVWSQSYAGRMPFPLWSTEYFEWQFGLSDGLSRDHLMAAYSGTTLIGTLLGIPFRFHLRGREFEGTQGSWLSVDPEFRRQRVGSQLRDQMLARHRERGLIGQFGYVFQGSNWSLGNPFWRSKSDQNSHLLRKVGFWARVLNPGRAARWNLQSLEAWATWLSVPILKSPLPVHSGDIRPAQSSDVFDCLNLMNTDSQHADLGIVWDEITLKRHMLGTNVGKCHVVEQNGTVIAMCTYHILPFQGRTIEPVGIIDFLISDSKHKLSEARLLNQVLYELKQAGAVLCLKLRSGCDDWRLLLRTQFIPRFSDSSLCFNACRDSEIASAVPDRLHLLWR